MNLHIQVRRVINGCEICFSITTIIGGNYIIFSPLPWRESIKRDLQSSIISFEELSLQKDHFQTSYLSFLIQTSGLNTLRLSWESGIISVMDGGMEGRGWGVRVSRESQWIVIRYGFDQFTYYTPHRRYWWWNVNDINEFAYTGAKSNKQVRDCLSTTNIIRLSYKRFLPSPGRDSIERGMQSSLI